MAKTDREYYKDLIGAQLDVNNDIGGGDGRTLAKEIWRRQIPAYLTDNGVAATAVAEQAVFVARRPGRLVACNVSTAINVAAHASNYVTITVAKRTAGGAATTMAAGNTISTGMGTLQEWSSYGMPLSATAGACDYAAGDVVTVKVAKASSGTAIATGYLGGAVVSPALVLIDVEEI